MSEFTMTINGKSAVTHASFDVVNPATGEAFAQCPQATCAQVNWAVKAAKAALKEWASDKKLRYELISRVPDILKANKEILGKLVTQEQGKPLKQGMGEVNSSLTEIELELEDKFPVEQLKGQDQVTTHVVRKPIGVVAGIAPWNYPLCLAVRKIIKPLIMGNTVVFKSAPTTPLSSLYLGALLRDVFPAGVFNVIAGGDDVGKWLVEHPDVAFISFTGSVATGKKIAQAAAKDLKRMTLELGGNDAGIVLGDVNVGGIAKDIFWGAFSNCGQICVALKRLYVHESIFPEMVKELTELAKNVIVGNGQDPQTEIGPLNNKMQFERVKELVADAKAHQATIETGGEAIGDRGYFYKPTIITGIQEGVRLVDEEQFGPVLPVMPFKTTEEAIKRANNTKMGLGASVWTANKAEGWKIANQLEAGTVWVNNIHKGHPSSPFGGFKQSGIGRENGKWGLEGLVEVQSIIVAED